MTNEPTPNADSVRCTACRDSGYVLDHDPRCPGGGRECERYCPVQLPCPDCAQQRVYEHRIIDGGPHRWHVCPDCGVFVADMERHDIWHASRLNDGSASRVGETP